MDTIHIYYTEISPNSEKLNNGFNKAFVFHFHILTFPHPHISTFPHSHISKLSHYHISKLSN